MSTKKKHHEAMDLFEEGLWLKRRDNLSGAIDLFKKAYELEKEVAMSFINDIGGEPNRSVLFRSAGSIAYNAELYDEALTMFNLGLSGNPPKEIELEILELIDTVNNLK